MHIRLFKLENGNVVPTEHCYMISWLNNIIEKFPENHVKIFAYIFYMTYRGPDNPYFNAIEEEREERIMRDLKPEFNTEDETIQVALDECTKIYETPIMRAHEGIKTMLDNMSVYMATTEITDGRDGNVGTMLRAAKEFKHIREGFKGSLEDLVDEEVQIKARGGAKLAYDIKRRG